MKTTWSCSRCHGIWRQRSHVRWYELWLRAVSARRPFCCRTCGRRAWSEPEDAIPVIPFTAPVEEVRDVSLVALDVIGTDLAPAGRVAVVEQPVFDNNPPPTRPRRSRVAGRRQRTRGVDILVH